MHRSIRGDFERTSPSDDDNVLSYLAEPRRPSSDQHSVSREVAAHNGMSIVWRGDGGYGRSRVIIGDWRFTCLRHYVINHVLGPQKGPPSRTFDLSDDRTSPGPHPQIVTSKLVKRRSVGRAYLVCMPRLRAPITTFTRYHMSLDAARKHTLSHGGEVPYLSFLYQIRVSHVHSAQEGRGPSTM